MKIIVRLCKKIEEKTNLLHRACIGFDLTDELFGLAINHEGKVNHKYIYGTYLVALPCWALGTALGIVAGNSLPTKIVASLSVALYGMFLAIIIPQAKKDRVIGLLIIISFLLSYICKDVPISGGTRTILLKHTSSPCWKRTRHCGRQHNNKKSAGA